MNKKTTLILRHPAINRDEEISAYWSIFTLLNNINNMLSGKVR